MTFYECYFLNSWWLIFFTNFKPGCHEFLNYYRPHLNHCWLTDWLFHAPEQTTATAASLSKDLGCGTVFLLNFVHQTLRWRRSETELRHSCSICSVTQRICSFSRGVTSQNDSDFSCGSRRSKGVPSGSGVFLRLLVGELWTPKLAQIFAYGKWLYPYRMLLHGASDLDQRCLKTRNSKNECTFGGLKNVPLYF